MPYHTTQKATNKYCPEKNIFINLFSNKIVNISLKQFHENGCNKGNVPNFSFCDMDLYEKIQQSNCTAKT